METRANFALIGAFTLAIVVAAFGFVYWFSGPSQTAQYKTYQLIFPGSVAGLLPGAAVQFNGLKVGEVTHLAISDEDPSRVDVLISIDKKTPVKANTRARLSQTGLTGVAVVSLAGGTPGAPDLEVKEGERYPRIQAEPSEIQNLMENVQRLSTRATDVFDKVDRLLDANSASLSAAVKNAETFTKALADNSGNVGDLLTSASDLAKSLKPAAARLDKLLVAGEQAIKALDPRKLKSITEDIAGASANINRFSASGLRQYEQLAVEGRKAVGTVDRAVKSLERDPQQVIFGASPAVPEYQGR
jgi:phospholipid/cholesterol/gamma-HCH transport system substrate-binding protein